MKYPQLIKHEIAKFKIVDLGFGGKSLILL